MSILSLSQVDSTVALRSQEEAAAEAPVRAAPAAAPVAAAPTAPAPTVRAPSSAEREAPTQPKTERITQYWIQAGSYTTQDRAEQVKDSLQEKGVVSRITSREVDGETYFRVRIGPYENSGEADKFLEWIRNMRGFESSYVSQVYVTRTVN